MKKRKPPYLILSIMGVLVVGAVLANLSRSGFFDPPQKLPEQSAQAQEPNSEQARKQMMGQLQQIKPGGQTGPTGLRQETRRMPKPEKPKEPGTNSQWW